MPIGDLAYYAGLLGLVIYGCFILIRQTGRTGKLTDAIRGYEARIGALEQRLTQLRGARDERSPGVDDLLEQVMALRERRDQLQIAFQDMQARARDRDIHIKTSSRGR